MNNIKVLHGNCYKIIKAIPSNSIDLVVTDPPYEEDKSGGGVFGSGHTAKFKGRIYRDQIDKMLNGFSFKLLDELCRVMKKINIYIWCSRDQLPKILKYFLKKGCHWDLIKYCKTNPVPACSNKYLSDTEYCLFFREKGVKVYGNYRSKHTYYVMPLNVKDKHKWHHPTIKPLKIIKNTILNSSRPNDIIFDPFAGSGTGGGCM